MSDLEKDAYWFLNRPSIKVIRVNEEPTIIVH